MSSWCALEMEDGVEAAEPKSMSMIVGCCEGGEEMGGYDTRKLLNPTSSCAIPGLQTLCKNQNAPESCVIITHNSAFGIGFVRLSHNFSKLQLSTCVAMANHPPNPSKSTSSMQHAPPRCKCACRRIARRMRITSPKSAACRCGILSATTRESRI
jgi:hypothetical protein